MAPPVIYQQHSSNVLSTPIPGQRPYQHAPNSTPHFQHNFAQSQSTTPQAGTVQPYAFHQNTTSLNGALFQELLPDSYLNQNQYGTACPQLITGHSNPPITSVQQPTGTYLQP